MRKTSFISMKSVHVTLLAVGFLGLSLSAQAFPFFKKKEKEGYNYYFCGEERCL